MEVGVIEADQVDLEHTRAQMVRGKTVIIRRGCEIECVEYSDDLKVMKGAQVKTRRKV